jgi:hypothetical protein
LRVSKHWCKKHKEVKRLYKSKNKSTGRVAKRYRCFSCISIIWRKNDKSPTGRYNRGKRQANERGLDFSITLEEYSIKITQPCYYCKNQLYKKSTRGVGLDRLNSNIGYTNDNTVSCCYVCNTIKNNFLTVEETQAAVKAIVRLRTKKSK